MKRIGILLFVGATAALAAVGCGDETTGTTTASTGTGGSGGGGGGGDGGAGGTSANPPAPKPGALIDRMGRPAISTALIHTFDNNPEAKDMAKDKYNTDEPEAWASHQPEVEKNLAILDGIDTICGNQLLAGMSVVPGRYAELAGALVDDRLWLNTAAMACQTYLAVEANATNVIPNADCGGRTLAYDVIDVSYSVLAVGALTGVTDSIDTPNDVVGEVFPYLAAPK
jgi:hypothetical protein